MSMIFMDGFDHYAAADTIKKWTGQDTALIDAAYGRRSGSSGLSLSSGKFVYKSFAATQTVIVGVAIKASGLGNGIFNVQDVLGTPQLTVSTTAGGGVSVLRGATVLGSSATGLIAANTFFHIELKAKIDPTVGTAELRINGVSVLALTGANTRNTANSQVTIVSLAPSINTCFYDDLYVCNASGTTANNFLGDCRIDTQFPVSDGTYAAFTPSAGTAHYANVDDATPNTTDYNGSATVGNRDSYRVGSLPALDTQTVIAVQVNATVLTDTAGTGAALAPFLRTGTTNKDGAGVVLTTSTQNLILLSETDAAGAAFTATSVNAMEIGVMVTA